MIMTKEKTICKKHKGMSLMELLIYIFVMSLIIMSATAVAASYIRGRSSIKRYQQNIEEMSLAINDMSKRIRMGNCEVASDCKFSNDKIEFKENSTGDSIIYRFNSASDELLKNGTTILEYVGGSFSIVNSSGIPLITIKLWKTDQNGDALDDTTIQTSVSQRSGYSYETP